MSAHFSQLLELDGSDFARRVQRKGGLWFFHHIPKTAGSSLVREIDFCFAPYCNVNGAEAGSNANEENRRTALNNALESFLEARGTRFWRSGSGHLRPVHLRRLREGVPDLRLFTFLRDPVARMISEYRYIRTPKHPGYRANRERYPDFESYLADETQTDRMWHYMTPAREVDDKTIDQLLRRYVFIGTVERMAPCFEFLSAIDGHPKTPVARTNVTPDDSDKVELTEELAARIAAANPRDSALYSRVNAILDQAAPSMAAHVDARRRLYAGQSPAPQEASRPVA